MINQLLAVIKKYWLLIIIGVILAAWAGLLPLTIFNAGSMPNERSMTLPDGNSLQVKDNGYGVIIIGNTIKLSSSGVGDRTGEGSAASITLLRSLSNIKEVKVYGNANFELGTGNFPSEGIIMISVENTEGDTAATLYKHGNNGGAIRIINPVSGRDRFAETFTYGVGGTGGAITGSFSDLALNIPEAYRSNEYKLVADAVVVGKAYSKGTITWTVDRVKTGSGNEISLNPTAPQPPTLLQLATQIKTWLSKILASIPFLTISGSKNPALGSTQTYTATLTAPYSIDTTYIDGTYSVRYCNLALAKSDGTILAEKGFSKCAETYAETLTAKIPAQAGQYAVIAIMAESKGVYDTDTQQWTFQPYEIVAKDALDINTKAPIPSAAETPTKPSINAFVKLFQNLFGWLFK